VLDAAQALRVVKLDLRWCSLSPASVPALVRLLNASALTELRVGNGGEPLDAPAAVLLGAALHASSTLTSLELTGVALWRDPAAASTLLRALTAHRSLRTLLLRHNDAETERHRRYAGRALGAFMTANAPALTGLYLGASALGDAGLRSLFDALRANTHLRSLFVDENGHTQAFARDSDCLLPAVRQNTSLRALGARQNYGDMYAEVDHVEPFTLQAEELVEERAAEAAAAQE
jgi:hypothetical protein